MEDYCSKTSPNLADTADKEMMMAGVQIIGEWSGGPWSIPAFDDDGASWCSEGSKDIAG